MKIINIKDNDNYLTEYIKLCNLEWGNKKDNIEKYIIEKKEKILNEDKVISVLGLIDEKELNKAILNEAKKLGYTKVYLKTELENYYEKIGAIFQENINDKEKLYYIPLDN